jgi:hypothetical protein
MNKVQYVTGLHGDEIVPLTALADSNQLQIIGNPKAVVKRKRYIDSDLNSAFGKKVFDYETKRAKELLKVIDPQIPVVDLHTFTNPSPPFVIIVDLDMLPLAKKTGIKRVVYMKHNIKAGGALINHRPGISVEVGQNQNMSSYRQTKKLINALKSDKEYPIELYEVYGILEKLASYRNFELHSEGFYPVLAGKSSYKHYGLKAKKIKGKI